MQTNAASGAALGRRDARRPGVRCDPGTPPILLDVTRQRGASWPATGLDVARRSFRFLDMHVGVEGYAHHVVGGVAAHDRASTADTPVVRKPDLVNEAPANSEWGHPIRHQDTRLDGGPRSDDRCPAQVLEPALGGELRRHLAEEFRL